MMRKQYRIALAAALAVSLTSHAAAANPVVFQQLPDPGVAPGSSSPISAEAGEPSYRSADDFTLPHDASIRDVRWWGLHHPHSSGQDDFTFTFYEDLEGLPGNILLETRGEAAVMTDAGIPALNLYRAALDIPLSVGAGVRYWLSIFNAEPNAAWGWNNSLDGNSRSAYYGTPPGNAWAANLASDGDLAFQIAVPEPTVLGIISTALGVWGLTRRRRMGGNQGLFA